MRPGCRWPCRLLLPDEAIYRSHRARSGWRDGFPQPNVVLVERTPEAARPSSASTISTTSSVRAGEGTDHQAGSARPVAGQAAPGPGCAGLGHRRRFRLGRPRTARLAPEGHVWAIEEKCRRRRKRPRQRRPFPHRQLHLSKGRPAALLDTWPDPDAGVHRRLGRRTGRPDQLILGRLKPGGRLVMNFVTLENLATATTTLQASWRRLGRRATAGQPQPAHPRHAPDGGPKPGLDRYRLDCKGTHD